MTAGARGTSRAWAWLVVAAALGLPALLCMQVVGPVLPATALGSAWVFHPGAERSLAEAFSLLTTAWWHLHTRHLAVNLLACLWLAWAGWRARLPWPWALAWAIAWPLTHAALWLAPLPLAWVVGASGVLHAGAAVLAVGLCRHGHAPAGGTLAVGLCAKLWHEAAWQQAVQPSAWLGMDVAASSHLAGVLAGTAMALCVAWGFSPVRLGGARPP